MTQSKWIRLVAKKLSEQRSHKQVLFSLLVAFFVFPFFQNCSGFTGEQISSSSFTVEDSSPENQDINEGSLVRLFVDVVAGDIPISYVWRKEGENTVLGTAAEYSFTAQLEDSGTYYLTITDAANQLTLEFNVNVMDVTQNIAPMIATKNVTSFTLTEGGNWNLNLSITGTPSPSLQWYFGTPPNGVALSSRTSATLSLSSVNLSHQGSYYLVASNSAGAATSQVFSLQVQAPVGSYKGSHIYLGGQERIRHLFFNPETQSLVDRGETAFVGASVGGLAHLDQKFFAVDVEGGNIQSYTIGANFSLTSVTNQPFLPKSVFVTVAEDFGKFLFFGASYADSKVAYYQADNLNLQGLTAQTTTNYPANSMSHSTSYSSTLNLLFAANLGQDMVRILNVTASGTSAAGQINVISPRNVHYDRTYGKLFVITEGRTTDSQLKIYSISKPTSTSATATEVGSFNFSQRGSDLKISYQRNLLFTAARESGQEAVYIIPLTSSGLRDLSRTVYRITSLPQEPRSISISNNGEYIFLTPNRTGDPVDLVVYRLVFNQNQQVISSSQVTQFKAGVEGFKANHAVDVP